MNKKAALIAVIMVATILRFFRLGETPPSPDWDEAAIGYNAYSILKTGRDEYGNFLPLTIRSFDDYKPPLYVYSSVPSVALFGLSVFAVRLPSAVFGILAVWGTIFLVRELLLPLFLPKPKKSEITLSGVYFVDAVSLLSGLLLSVSPWHIQFSRIAFEANLGLTLNIWLVAFFLRAVRKQTSLVPAAILTALAFYAYHSERIFVPLLILILTLALRGRLFLKNYRKKIIFGLIAGSLLVLPLLPVVLSGTTLSRFSGTSSFANQTELLSGTVRKLESDLARGDRLGLVFDNRRVEWVKTFAGGYLSHFSPKWLFLTGDNPRHHAPDMGLMYLWELPFLLAGLVWVFKTGSLLRTVLFGWLLIAPVAAAPTTGLPHAVRTLVFLPVFQIFTAVGLFWTALFFQTSRILKPALAAFGLLALGSFFYFLAMYFDRMDREVSRYWQYGYKEAVAYAEANKNRYEKVVVSLSLEQPYIFFLFYTKYDPATYLSGGGTRSGGFAANINAFDKYEFRKINWPEEKRDGSILYIGSPDDIPHRFGSMVTYLDGSPAFEIVDRE
jgi:4-amino-4-deoxy-L-arabinose transferase-like glycosyltransferase